MEIAQEKSYNNARRLFLVDIIYSFIKAIY